MSDPSALPHPPTGMPFPESDFLGWVVDQARRFEAEDSSMRGRLSRVSLSFEADLDGHPLLVRMSFGRTIYGAQ